MPGAKKTRVKQLDDAALGTAHTLSGDDIAAHWVVQPAVGLSAEEALQRQSQFGLNPYQLQSERYGNATPDASLHHLCVVSVFYCLYLTRLTAIF